MCYNYIVVFSHVFRSDIMFKIGDYVVNANNGICKIADEVVMSVAGSEKKYFLIVPIEEESAKIYIAVDKADTKIRMIIDESRANDIIDSMPNIEPLWVDNDKQREQKYKEAIQSCDPVELIRVIKSMYNRKMERSAQGKKNTVIDERYYMIAQNNLYSELAFSLGKNKNEIEGIIYERIGN